MGKIVLTLVGICLGALLSSWWGSHGAVEQLENQLTEISDRLGSLEKFVSVSQPLATMATGVACRTQSRVVTHAPEKSCALPVAVRESNGNDGASDTHFAGNLHAAAGMQVAILQRGEEEEQHMSCSTKAH